MASTTADQTEKIQRIAHALMLAALSASAKPEGSTFDTEELVTASLALMAATCMLAKRVGLDDAETKDSLSRQLGAVFDAVHYVPKAVGDA